MEAPVTLVESGFTPTVTWTRGDAAWPAPTGRLFAGGLEVEATFTTDVDPWFGCRNARCPGCGILWADAPAGHSWSSAKDGCWTETGPIDGYGRPIRESNDDDG